VRLSRHAKNELRRLEASVADVEGVIADPIRLDHDRFGKPRYTGYIGQFRVRVVVALDEPNFVVTIHERKN
jgi:hypothetical protein